MTAVTTEREMLHTATNEGAVQSSFTVVVVAPEGEIATCLAALTTARSRGACTIACEVSADPDGFDEAFSKIVDTVSQAGRDFPGSPIVLVGHGAAALPARAYADLCPTHLSGVLMTLDPVA